MFEAKLTEGNILKKIIEAIKDLVTDVNIEVSPAGKYTSHFDSNSDKEANLGNIPRLFDRWIF